MTFRGDSTSRYPIYRPQPDRPNARPRLPGTWPRPAVPKRALRNHRALPSTTLAAFSRTPESTPANVSIEAPLSTPCPMGMSATLPVPVPALEALTLFWESDADEVLAGRESSPGDQRRTGVPTRYRPAAPCFGQRPSQGTGEATGRPGRRRRGPADAAASVRLQAD